MNKDVVIKVENLGKTFKLFNNPRHRLLEALHPFRKKYHHDYQAVRGVSFEIKKGESVGILGMNGAGKSTLLKLLTGVLTPTTGTVEVQGRIAALLELGSGFNPEMSGMDNIYFQGAIVGFNKEEMELKIPKIVEFAEIGEFVHQPVKTYSSGMFARLAFSIAINVDPDILIIDEALSVGDTYFQTKCMNKMHELLNKKEVTLLFVSHSTFAIRNLCNVGILLEKGKMIKIGDAADVVETYFMENVKSTQVTVENSEVAAKDDIDPDFLKSCSLGRVQNGKGKFVNVSILDEHGHKLTKVSYNQKVNLKLEILITEDADCLGFSFHLKSQEGIEVMYSGSGVDVGFLENLKAGMKIVVDNYFEVRLIQGVYTIALVLSKSVNTALESVEFYDFIPMANHFEMIKRSPIPIYGFVGINNTSKVSYFEERENR